MYLIYLLTLRSCVTSSVRESGADLRALNNQCGLGVNKISAGPGRLSEPANAVSPALTCITTWASRPDALGSSSFPIFCTLRSAQNSQLPITIGIVNDLILASPFLL